MEIPSNAPFGQCPQCLLALGFGPLPKGALDSPAEFDTSSPSTPPEQKSTGNETVPPSSFGLTDPRQPSGRIGRYKLLEKIGEGGCGVVYMAEQEEPVRRRVALKILKLGMDTRDVIARFEAERQALALMDHPHIAKIFDGGATETGRPFFVMELVRGQRITDYCNQKNLSTRQRLDLFTQVCHAVQHAHQKGIIHRDLKPSNILITVNDGVAVPKVIDFGIAKATGQSLTDMTLFTKFNQFLGSPAYTSPEQAEMTSLDIDTRSDIYSLGVLLYELLTGRLPFDSKEFLAAGFEVMLRTIREKEPQRPSTRLSTMPVLEQTTVAQQRQTDVPTLLHLLRGDLDWIVVKCLEKDRARRYETANGLATDLQRHLNDMPVSARPPGNFYRLQKAMRRNKVAFAAGGAILVSLVIGLGTSTIMFMRERAERHSGDIARAQVVQKNTDLERKNAEYRAMLVEAARSDRIVAQDRLRSGREQSAFVHLARACEYDPSSTLAAEMAIGALGTWNHEVPITILAGHQKGVKSAHFNPDGTRIVTASDDNTARVWDAATGRMLAMLSGHTREVWSAEFSPDGTRIVTGSSDNTARVWDVATGRMLAMLSGHTGEVWSAEFSPDGTRILTASLDNTARVWDARSGKALLRLAADPLWRKTPQFSPAGTHIVTVDFRAAVVWDAETGKSVAMLNGHTGRLRDARFSADGTRIVTASDDKTVRVWDARSGNALLTLAGHEESVESAQFSPDGTRIVTAGQGDKTVRVWDAGTGKLLRILAGHKGYVSRAQFSPDGERILSASWSASDSTVRLWDASTGKALATLAGHQESVCSADFSSDGKRIVTASDDKTARIWQAVTLRMTLAKPFGQSAFSPEGERIATTSNEKTVRVGETAFTGDARLEEIATAEALATLAGHTGKVRRAKFSLNGRHIMTTSERGPAQLWEVATGKALAALAGPTGEVQVAEFSRDGTRIVTASTTEPARLWDATGKMLATLVGHTGAVRFVRFSPDSKRLVTAGRDDKTARVWEAETGKLLRTLAHKGEVTSAQFSPDGTRIFTTVANEPVRVWDSTAGNLLATLGDTAWRTWAQFSPDGTRMLTVSQETFGETIASGQIRLWDLASGQLPVTLVENTGQLGASAEFGLDGTRIITTIANEPPRLWEATTGKALATLGHRSSAGGSATFSPDGRRIVTTARIVSYTRGAIAQLWDSANGEALAKLRGHTGIIRSALFSSDGTRIVTASDDGTVRVWDSITGEKLAILTVNEAAVPFDQKLVTRGSSDVRLRWAQFSSDGSRIVATSFDGTVRLWDVLPKGTPTPDWFPDFLRYMAQLRLNSDDGQLEQLKPADWLALQERLRRVLRTGAAQDTPYLRILRRYVPE